VIYLFIDLLNFLLVYVFILLWLFALTLSSIVRLPISDSITQHFKFFKAGFDL